MGELLVSSNVSNLNVGQAVKLKHQPYSPTMTIAGISRGRPEGSNAIVAIATCNWFEEDGAPKGLTVELNALDAV